MSERGGSRTVPDAPERAAAVESLRAAHLRAEILLEEVPAPGRLAPFALALSADVGDPDDDVELASGRFVLLHDPARPTPWEGAWRVVTYSRALLTPDLATDPLLGEIGWTWLRESLDRAGAGHRALAGTVTRVVSERFGQLADEPDTVELEIRASWSPTDAPDGLGRHLEAWGQVLGELGGLPPLPDGVTALPTVRW